MAHCEESLGGFKRVAEAMKCPPKQLAMAFTLQNAPQASVVIGAENARQVRENVLLMDKAEKMDLPDMRHLAVKDREIIDPSKWVTGQK
jgi:aryl-alcohol dehydrogenase-like predicted oxidoreductase